MATTVTPAATASFELGPFDTLTLSSGGARGSIVLTSQAPKLCADQVLSPQNGTFGPWGVPMSVVMTITQGSCDYTVNVRSLTATAARSLVSGGGNFDATDAGTDWLSAPATLAVRAELTAGTATVVLLQTKDKNGTVSTAVTFDRLLTVGDVDSVTVALKDVAQYRLIRSTGTGTVNLLVQR